MVYEGQSKGRVVRYPSRLCDARKGLVQSRALIDSLVYVYTCVRVYALLRRVVNVSMSRYTVLVLSLTPIYNPLKTGGQWALAVPQ